jgi:uncharacterized membrane protein
MTTNWVLNILSLYFTTVGALLIFLYLWRSPRFADEWLSEEGKRAYRRHRRLLMVAVGLLAIWLVVAYLGLILLDVGIA